MFAFELGLAVDLLCAPSCHVLTSLVYKMTMMHDLIVNPIELAS